MIEDRPTSPPAKDGTRMESAASAVLLGVTGAAVFLVARKVGLHAELSETIPGAPFPVPRRNDDADGVQIVINDKKNDFPMTAFRFTDDYWPW